MERASRERLDEDIFEVGSRLVEAMPSPIAHPLRALDERAMDLASDNAQLRAALLRFIDVAPACRSLDDLAAHLVGLLRDVDERSLPLDAAIRLGDSKAGRAALGTAAAAGVRHVAHRFIVGETPQQAEKPLRALWREGVGASVDLLGEATLTAGEADAYAERCAEALEAITRIYAPLARAQALERDSIGAIPRANLSVKVSALTPLLRAQEPELGERDAAPRLRALLRRARELDAHLHVDMESFDAREAVSELVLTVLAEDEFREGPSAGIVLQAYLRESPEHCERIVEWARAARRDRPLVVRLVKGAYWDHEVIEALQHGWRPPVFERKSDCDRNFEALTVRLLDARPHVRPAIASHNLRSIAHAIVANERTGADARDVEYQVLRGLGDDIQQALAREDYRVRAYCPVGDVVAGMAYLVRRVLENTSNESFLLEHASGRPLEELLAAP